MRVLFLTRDLPYPDDNGYKKRNMSLIRELSRRGFHVILFSQELDNDKVSINADLSRYCKDIIIVPVKEKNRLFSLFLGVLSIIPFGVRYRSYAEILNSITDYINSNPVDMIICDSLYRALNIPLSFKAHKMLYEHNIESVIIKRYMNNTRNFLVRVFAFMELLKLRRFERLMWRRFDSVIACSQADKAYMLKEVKEACVCVVNNGVDTKFFKAGEKAPGKDIVFTGQIGWYPNQDAVLYFAGKIFPLVAQEIPDAVLWIVGSSPCEKIKALADKNPHINVTGFVEDIRPYIEKAKAYIVPIRIGAGTRLKILEALSMEKIVVTTSIGCEGLETEDGKHLIIRDDEKGFAKAVIDLLRDDSGYMPLAKQGRELVEKRYDWSIVFKGLEEILG